MAISLTTKTNQAEGSPERPQQAPALPRRRRWWLVGLGVAMVAASVLGVQAYVDRVNETVPVLILARDVAWNQRITDSDLAVAEVTPDERVHMIPAEQRKDAIGRVAAHKLSAGSLLAVEHIHDHAVPGPGQLVIGLLLKPGQLPARGLRAEDRVQVVPVAQNTFSTSPAPEPKPVNATVVDVGPADANGAVTVDIVVSVEDGPVTTSAAAGQVVVSLVGPQG
jgi:hypothetical protein